MENRQQFEQALTLWGVQGITDRLQDYLTAERKKRIENVLSQRINSVHIAAAEPSDIYNALAILRSTEALGVDQMHIIEPEGKVRRGKNTVRGACRWLDLNYHWSIADFYSHMRAEGLLLVAAEVDGALSLEDVPVEKPLCLIFGNENRGLNQTLSSLCDFSYRIPLSGMTESLNLSASAAISLYDILRRKRHALGRAGDLSDEDLALRRAWYYYRSVESKLRHALLSGGAIT